MEPLIDARLKVIEDKLDKDHELLLKIRRVQKNAQLFRLFYWLLLILAAFGSFYYLEPYISSIMGAYTGIQNTQNQLQNALPELGGISDILKQLKGLQ